MNKEYDFSDFKKDAVYYGGTERKIGVIDGDRRYILKFRKMTEFGPRFNHISEYIGSHVFQIAGIESQSTCLGTYHGEPVVACKVFMGEDETFVPFNEVGESTLETDRDRFQYSYDDIMSMLESNRKLTDVHDTISGFWDVYIIDALTGNFDRHGNNWGFIKKNGKYRLSPVFDNGSCLYPQITDEDSMQRIIQSEELTNERIFRFPSSQIKLGEAKSSYYDVINSMRFEECNNALLRVFPRIDMNRIINMIDGIGSISETRKTFYRHMLKNRYDKVLASAYSKLEESL